MKLIQERGLEQPKWWRLRRFWRAWLAGRLGIFCLRLGFLVWAEWLVRYEGQENRRVALGVRR